MSIIQKILSRRIVILFRLFLWWGKNMMSTVIFKKFDRPGIIRISESNNFPVSLWCVRKESMYCFVTHQDESKVDIIKLPDFCKN